MDQATVSFGRLLRQWRTQRRLSQLELALRAEVSPRHLSWLETGRAQPSRAMVLRLAETLDVPLRDRNPLLRAAGYAALYHDRPLDDSALAPAREALQRLLDAHEPYPALAVDRHWHLVAHNRMVMPLLQGVAPFLAQPPINVLRLSLHPQGLAPLIENAPAWRDHVLRRLRRQQRATGDAELTRLHDELAAWAAPAAHAGSEAPAVPDDVAVPLVLRTPLGRLSFITTLTVFGAPHDVTLSELAVETLLPADPATAEALRKLQEGLPHKGPG
jgi:transcriptional regulator with XRE-family HTH domain